MPAGKNGMVGFLWKFWHALPYTNRFGLNLALFGKSDIGIVYQPEAGGRWLHLAGRADFISIDALPWTCGWINSASNVIDVGEEHRLYFSGRIYSHGYSLDENWARDPKLLEYMKQHPVSGITFAIWPKWRLFGFEADPEAGFTIRLGRIEKPVHVLLNYESIKPGGHIRASAQVDEGDIIKKDKEKTIHKLEDSLSLTGDGLAGRLTWKTGDIITPTRSATITLHMTNARVYSYDVIPAS